MRKFYMMAIFLLAFFPYQIQAQQLTEKTVLDLVKDNTTQLRISAEDASYATVSSYFTDASTGILYAYIQQNWNGIKVFNSIITTAFRDGKLLYTSGRFVNGISSKAIQPTPSIHADQAVMRSAEHLQLSMPVNLFTVENKFAAEKKMIFSPAGIAKQNIQSELYWVTDDDFQNVRLAWNVNIDVQNSADWWNVRIDAVTGEFIEKDNWTVFENHHFETDGASENKNALYNSPINHKNKFQTQYFFQGRNISYLPPAVTDADYYVVPHPFESPRHGAMALVNKPWLAAGAGNNAITHGWHFDGTNDYDVTRGNNVHAYLDLNNSNNPASPPNIPVVSSTPIPDLTFNFVPDFNQEPSLTLNRQAAVTNLFYWNNVIHDVLYQYGFNEASGNFQTDNMGRGGTGNDYVQAEAQDGGGTNNANFATPADGTRPRMQMYLWSGVPTFTVNAPANIAGNYLATESGFSLNNKLINVGPVTGQVVYYDDDAGGTTHDACVVPFNSVAGKIALINRGNCTFVIKVKNAQDAGAIAVIMVNNVPGLPITMGGTDNTITIPAVMISNVDGATIAAELVNNVNVTLAGGVGLDGDFDNGIITHEFGHGVSNRLTGGRTNSSCLGNAEQGGEGWSDYLALMLATNWAAASLTDGSLPRPVGAYALGHPLNGQGIRTAPYSTNLATSPQTYTNMPTMAVPHGIGEIWCSALWEMTWAIIQQEGSIDPNIYNSTGTGGNVIALRLVMEGMRLQSCRPGFLDARNAILAADSILYNYRHKCAIWSAFAKRGMGYSASQGSTTSTTDGVPAFDVPSSVSLSKSSSPVAVRQGLQVTVNLSTSCECLVPLNNYVIRDTIPAGFSYVSSTGGVLSGNVVTFSPVNFSTPYETKTYSITLQSVTPGCNIDTSINDNQDGSTIGGLTSAAITGVTQWVPSSVRFSSPTNSWFAADVAGVRDFTLTSNAFTAGNLSVLSFKHYYVMENYIDGGRIEISTDNGTNWSDAGPYIVQNGYNTSMNATSPWGNNQRAFSGVSYGQGSNQFINTVIDLSSFSGQSVMIRLRMRSNATNTGNPSYEGWFVDDILQMNGCGGIVKSGIYNSSGVRVDSSVVPLFAIPAIPPSFTIHPSNIAVCPGTTVTFTAAATGIPTPTYQWEVSTNGGTTYTSIAGQTSLNLTLTATTAMNGYMYRLVATNVAGSVNSNAATLTVYNPVAISTHPANATVCVGANVTFSVVATGSPTPLAYQWEISTNGGSTYSNIAGANSTNYTLNSVTTALSGNRYRVSVTGYCGTLTSTAAILTVNAPTPVTISPLPSRICLSDTMIVLTGTPVGGVWSGVGVIGNNFLPVRTAVGQYTLTYTFTNSSGCVSSASVIAKVEDCPERRILLRDNAVIVYPNPNSGQFNIRINSTLYSYLGMKVYASNGALVHRQAFAGLQYGRVIPIDLGKLAPGVYQVYIYYDGGVRTSEKTFKIIIAGH